jgi:HAD superfamily hydrolase (TIGR01509 family)
MTLTPHPSPLDPHRPPSIVYPVIFDMDGVIVDSERHWKLLEGFFLRSLVPAWGERDQGRIIGLSLHDLYRMLVDEYGVTETRERFTALYFEMANEIYAEKVSLMEGFQDVLLRLAEQDVPVALASSSPLPWINIVLDRFALRPYFRVVISADELADGEGKPSPTIYLLAAQRLGVAPGDCIVIEDSQNGVLSAKRAGMYCIGFRNGFNDEQDLSAADTIIHSFHEFNRMPPIPENPGIG